MLWFAHASESSRKKAFRRRHRPRDFQPQRARPGAAGPLGRDAPGDRGAREALYRPENPGLWSAMEVVCMAVLDNSKHEHFAQLVAKFVSATKAYTSAGYSDKGAKQSAARLLTNADLCARIRELQETLSAGTIALEISSRNARVQALQHRWDKMRQVITERAAHYAKGGDDESDAIVPGGETGLLVKDFKGKEAD